MNLALRIAPIILVITGSLTVSTSSSAFAAESPLQLVKSGKAIVVDVREDAEIKGPKGMVDGASHLSTSAIEKNSKPAQDFIAALDKNKIIYAYCAVGGRSGKFVEKLRKLGFKAENLGGIADVESAGFPITHPK